MRTAILQLSPSRWLRPRRGLIAAITAWAIVFALSLDGAVVTPQAAAQGSQRAYIGLFKEDAVAVLDIAAGVVTAKIKVPTGPHGLAASLDGQRVYVASDGSNTVTAIDTVTNTVAQTVEVGKAPHGIALTPDGLQLLVGAWGDNQVTFMDTATGEVRRQSPVPAAHNIAITPDGTHAYVGSQAQDAPTLVKLNVASGEREATIQLDRAPRGLSISPDGSWLYLTRAGADDVLIINLATGAEAGRIAIGPSPHLPTFLADGRATVDSQGLGQLFTINASNQTVAAKVDVGQRPHWTAITADGTLALQTNEGSNDVTVVDLATFTARATFPVGEAPRKIVVVPAPTAASSSASPTTVSRPASPPEAASSSMAEPVDSHIQRFRFDTPISVGVGQAVRWINDDSTAHTVTGDGREWGSKVLEPGQSFSWQFAAPGSYPYSCDLHSYMRGRVIVG